MTKIHPNRSSVNSSFCGYSSERETFTVWMKSLVFHGNGCTVFNSRGEVVFRVDNYQKKCSSKVFLMDSTGQTLFSIYRKKLRFLGWWDGFKGEEEKKPWFRVRRNHSIFGRDISCRVILKCDQNSTTTYYKIIGLEGKPSLKIIDLSGHLLAQAIQKQSSEGIPLGEDVLTLMVEPNADQALIVALLTIYSLINNTL
ncbi:protein LURP-one-related 4-like [Salvia miltiorrhiza]|uniref:protein LURP-one-related 4-like n=1 Tax=Salvia miltiorrhiza TaxID=226208 RepID=UPI0025AD478D|nr:protein LURP-one-related 4-like [Salvia miltiorrhiza]